MKAQGKSNGREIRLATCMALGALLFCGGTAAHASGERDSGRSIQTTASSADTSRAKQDRQSLIAERARISNLQEKRDPFKVPQPRVDGKGDTMEGPLPPGLRGLVIGAIQLKGIVRDDAANTMIAVVTNRANLAYFLHIHDKVYNGVVEKITPDSVYFQQDVLDADGRLSSHEVVLKLGSGL